MKFRSLLWAASISILAACSQLEQPVLDSVQDYDSIERIIFEVKPIIDDDIQTKATAVPQSDGSVDFAWEVTDTIGVYPNTGSQIYFLPTSGVGTSSVEFTGGGWAMKSNSTYVSYYPFVGDIYLKRDRIPVSFVGQKQVGTIGPFNGARYILATEPTSSSGGVLRFTYNTLNTIINVNATLPAGTYTSASLTITEPNYTGPLFVEKGSYSMDDRIIVGKEYSNTLEVELENFILTEQASVPIYFMAAPIDLTGKEVTVFINSADGKRYKCIKKPTAPYQAGRRRGLTCMMERDVDIISFEDPEVKRICVEVANWDTDGDGEIDMEEAAAVTDLGTFFRGSTVTPKTISSFDELQYFTGLTSIGENAFSYCENLTSITIPDSVTSIEDSAFYRCMSLSSITIPDGVPSIGNYVFYYCMGLTNITIPNSVTTIGDYAFFNCPNLTNIALPTSITSIGNSAFFSCSSITSITIPDSVTSIGVGVFSGCRSLLSFEGKYATSDGLFLVNEGVLVAAAFAGNEGSVVIPDGVTSLGNWVFGGYWALTNITLPTSLTTIGNLVFSGCSSLISVVVLAETPPVLPSNTFNSANENLLIYVPSESVDEYKVADGWSNYANKIRALEGGTTPGSGNDGDD